MDAAKKRWYHNADFLVRGRNAMNSLLVYLLGFMLISGSKLGDLVRIGARIPVDYIMVFLLFFGCYLLVVYFREILFVPNGDLLRIEKTVKQTLKEINERIDNIE